MNARQGGKGLSSAFVQHEPVDVLFDEPSRTRQEFAAECDINVIMAGYERSGVLSHMNPVQPMYLDLSEGVPDLRESLDIVRTATESFMSLPARVRAQFDNDPVAFVDYCGVEANRDQLKEWGLLKPEAPEPPVTRVEVVNASPQPGPPPKP